MLQWHKVSSVRVWGFVARGASGAGAVVQGLLSRSEQHSCSRALSLQRVAVLPLGQDCSTLC